tara:strand:+ start:81 stop:275 length:195 start_codon:yes stop_codon:yes gene_type:complete
MDKLIEWRVVKKIVRVEECYVQSPPEDYVAAEEQAMEQDQWEEATEKCSTTYEVTEEWRPEDDE